MSATPEQTKLPSTSASSAAYVSRAPADFEVSAAVPADAAAIATLLRDAGLPHEDIAAHVERFFVARDQTATVVGAVGAELCGDAALLRSLVVASVRRGRGISGALLAALEHAADAWAVREWWLLTTTAESFFAARGFRVAPREAAPPGIRATAQFRELCSAAAVCMRRQRRPG